MSFLHDVMQAVGPLQYMAAAVALLALASLWGLARRDRRPPVKPQPMPDATLASAQTPDRAPDNPEPSTAAPAANGQAQQETAFKVYTPPQPESGTGA